jgi:hypothetical protein
MLTFQPKLLECLRDYSRARVTADVLAVLHLAAVTALDATALNAPDSLHEKLRHHKKHLILSGPHTQPYFLLEKSGLSRTRRPGQHGRRPRIRRGAGSSAPGSEWRVT